ncbi:MAG TPA: SDR family oxidoreductase [Planctomycetes bacterium]|nr:SDR family oxidoreductase [Planctomycetota bacterium]
MPESSGESGRRVLVTGAGRGIGRAIALAFAVPGARIVVAARTASEIASVAEEIEAAGARALPVRMDVTDLASVEHGMALALEFTGGAFDLVVNNAGAFTVVPFEEMSPATWYRLLAVNLNGPFHVSLLALEGLARGQRAHLVNVSSVAGRMPFEGSSAYCATKYGLRGLSDVLRLEWKERGIRVSTLYPGATDTTIFDDVPGEWDRSQMDRPEDVAAVVHAAHFAPDGVDVADLDVPEPRLTPDSRPTSD